MPPHLHCVSSNTNVLAGSGSGASGFVVSGNLLNSTTAQVVQIGNGGNAGITLQGNLDLSHGSIGELYATTGGIYDGSGASFNLAPQTLLYVNAGSINTGNVSGGREAIFQASGSLNINGNIPFHNTHRLRKI